MLLQPSHQQLQHIPTPIRDRTERWPTPLASTPLFFRQALLWNRATDAHRAKVATDRGGVIASVRYNRLWSGSRVTQSYGGADANANDHFLRDGTLTQLSCRQEGLKWVSVPVTRYGVW